MAFGKKFDPKVYPKRRWSLVGKSGDGKSAFAAAMRGPIAVVDADGRFDETVLAVGLDNAFAIANSAQDMRDVDKIQEILLKNMPKAEVGTLVVDSVTPIIQRVITEIQNQDKAVRVNDWTPKAQAMKILGDVTTAWSTDVLYIYHYVAGVDMSGNTKTSTSISALELSRLQQHLNAKLEIVRDGQKRGIKVLYSRGRSGEILWDEEGFWKGMPERLEAYMYDNLTDTELEQIARGNFSTPDEAWAWAVEQGAFDDVGDNAVAKTAKAKNSYLKLKKELFDELGDELTAPIMFEAWREKVYEKLEK